MPERRSIGIKKLAATLESTIEDVAKGEVIITRSKKPVAVLIGYEEYEKLLAELKNALTKFIIKED